MGTVKRIFNQVNRCWKKKFEEEIVRIRLVFMFNKDILNEQL